MTASPPPPAETPDTTPASLGADAVEYTHAFLAAVESLIHRPGDGLSLLDWRVAESTLDDHQREQILQGGALPTSACVNAARQDRDRRWQQGVMAALDTGAKLDQTLPETVEASPARQGIYAVLNVLRFDAELDQLPDEWPHIRSVLRCYVLGYVREDDPEDLEALDRALEACGVAPLCEPEPRAAAAALRTVLRELLATRATRRERFLLRSDYVNAHARGSSPRRGRYLLAVSLSERRPLVAGGGKPRGTARSSGLLEDPRPNDHPTLPVALVAPALILLAVLDALEAKADGGRRRPRESAYHVLRIVSVEKRWPATLRATMARILGGETLPESEVFRLARAPVEPRNDVDDEDSLSSTTSTPGDPSRDTAPRTAERAGGTGSPSSPVAETGSPRARGGAAPRGEPPFRDVPPATKAPPTQGRRGGGRPRTVNARRERVARFLQKATRLYTKSELEAEMTRERPPITLGNWSATLSWIIKTYPTEVGKGVDADGHVVYGPLRLLNQAEEG